VTKLDQLQQDIANTLSRLEMHFPLTYFDMSMHLLVHLVDQIRGLGHIKKYLRDKFIIGGDYCLE